MDRIEYCYRFCILYSVLLSIYERGEDDDDDDDFDYDDGGDGDDEDDVLHNPNLRENQNCRHRMEYNFRNPTNTTSYEREA
jgi:hypothetical protein